jgi:8-oxo-dGTP pyrophosphatase MutT (NUDIX family)
MPAPALGGPDSRRAAVAAVLREAPAGVELLLIHRAEHPDDPWSGHLAFPGGRLDPDDPDPLAAAIRETREEVALDLERDARLLGRLTEIHTHLRTGPAPHSVVPFVFELLGEPPLAPNDEVQETLWVALDFLADRRNRSAFTWMRDGRPVSMPCYRIGPGVLWGLTLRLVDELLEIAARASTPRVDAARDG